MLRKSYKFHTFGDAMLILQYENSCVLIVAGGSGTRFNDKTPKTISIIDNKPILMYTIERFCQLDNIYVVIPKCHLTTGAICVNQTILISNIY